MDDGYEVNGLATIKIAHQKYFTNRMISLQIPHLVSIARIFLMGLKYSHVCMYVCIVKVIHVLMLVLYVCAIF